MYSPNSHMRTHTSFTPEDWETHTHNPGMGKLSHEGTGYEACLGSKVRSRWKYRKYTDDMYMFVCILLENLVYMMQYHYLLSHGVYYAPNYLLTSKIYILWPKSSHFLIPQLLSITTLCSILWIWLCWFQIVDCTMSAFVLPFAMAWGRSTCLKFSLPQKMLTCQRTTVTTDSQCSKASAWVMSMSPPPRHHRGGAGENSRTGGLGGGLWNASRHHLASVLVNSQLL